MATITVTSLIRRAETISQDTTGARWAKEEWLDWFNDGCLEVVNHRPDALVKNISHMIDAQALQTIPSDGLRLMSVVCNTVSGLPIIAIKRQNLDNQRRPWHREAASDVKHYIYDPRDPKHFYIHPYVSSPGHQIEIIYSVAPTRVVIAPDDFDTDTTVIQLDDNYANAILDYMMYRAYSKDAADENNASRAGSHYQSFANSIGAKTNADAATLDPLNRPTR